MARFTAEYQKKTAAGYETVFTEDDEKSVYKNLSDDLTKKYLVKVSCITRIRRVDLQNGYQKITVTYNNNTRVIYTIQA